MDQSEAMVEAMEEKGEDKIGGFPHHHHLEMEHYGITSILISLSIYLSIYLFIYLSIYLYIYL